MAVIPITGTFLACTAVLLCAASFLLPVINIALAYTASPSSELHCLSTSCGLTPTTFLFYQGLGCLVTTIMGCIYFGSTLLLGSEQSGNSTRQTLGTWIEIPAVILWVLTEAFNALWSLVGIPVTLHTIFVCPQEQPWSVIVTMLLNQAFLGCMLFSNVMLLHSWLLPQCVKHCIFRKPSMWLDYKK